MHKETLIEILPRGYANLVENIDDVCRDLIDNRIHPDTSKQTRGRKTIVSHLSAHLIGIASSGVQAFKQDHLSQSVLS